MKLENHILYKTYQSKFDELKECVQDPIHHGEGDVFTHTQMVIDSLYSDLDFQRMDDYSKLILELCAILHDIEKPYTRTEELINDRITITHRKHGRYGAETALKMLTELDYDIGVIYDVYNLILFHGKPFWVANRNDPSYEVIKLSHQTRIDWLYIFAKADLFGRICYDEESILENLELMKMVAEELDCYDSPYEFKTLSDKYDYFNNNSLYADKHIQDYFDYNAVLMCGIPASGKSTYIKENLHGYKVLSTDNIRLENKLDFSKKSFSKIFNILDLQIGNCCRNHEDFVIDATNIRYDLRKKLIDKILNRQDGNGCIEIIWLQKTLQKCITHNLKREGNKKVETKYIEKSYYNLQQPTQMECHKLRKIRV